MADSARKVRRLLAAHPGYRTNKAGTRIACLGCGEILDLEPAPAAGPTEASAQDAFIDHLMEVLRPFTDKFDQLAGPPF